MKSPVAVITEIFMPSSPTQPEFMRATPRNRAAVMREVHPHC